MTISPRDRLIITIAVAVLIVVGLIAGLIYPQFQKLRLLNAQVAEATAQANAAELQLAQRQAFKDRAIDTNAKWLRLMNQVPDGPDLPAFIIELQDTAFRSGVQVLSITPALPASEGAFSGIPVSFEVVGTWSDTIDYLESLMRLDRGVRLMNFSTTQVGSGGSVARRNSALSPYAVNTIINVKTYLIPSAPATPAAVPAP